MPKVKRRKVVTRKKPIAKKEVTIMPTNTETVSNTVPYDRLKQSIDANVQLKEENEKLKDILSVKNEVEPPAQTEPTPTTEDNAFDKEKVQVTHSFGARDAMELINKDPSKRYRFILKNEVQREIVNKGYSIVDNPEKHGVAPDFDLVLCERPKEVAQKHREYLDAKAKRELGGVSTQAQDSLIRAGSATASAEINIERENRQEKRPAV